MQDFARLHGVSDGGAMVLCSEGLGGTAPRGNAAAMRAVLERDLVEMVSGLSPMKLLTFEFQGRMVALAWQPMNFGTEGDAAVIAVGLVDEQEGVERSFRYLKRNLVRGGVFQ